MTSRPFCAFKSVALCLCFVLSIVRSAQSQSAHPPTLKMDGPKPYKAWLEQDVRWIVTKEELQAFKSLTDDEQRDIFIEEFWDRRNPDPNKLENTFKSEHYRRLLYAKEHFSERDRGWETDRGKAYVILGPPERVEHRVERFGAVDRDVEVWTYSGSENHPKTAVKFVDACSCEEFRAMDDARIDIDKLNHIIPEPATNKIQLMVAAKSSPPVHFKDLEELIAHRVTFKTLPVAFSIKTIPITDVTDQVALQFIAKCTSSDSSQPACNSIRYFGRVSTITGRIVETFEGEAACDSRDGVTCNVSREMPLRRGLLRFEIAVSDADGKRFGTITQAAQVQ